MLDVGRQVERYTVEAPLGEGGMAQVYRVRHGQLGTLHALKVLTLGHSSIRERFLHEGRVQATLHHPNVVAVTDVLEVDGAPALLLEFVDGPTLHDWIDQPYDLATAERVFRSVVAGVQAAHAKGLVHRDLKPANVLMARIEGEWVPKVADFGLAKAVEDGGHGTTRSGIAMGTPAYMAPEQIRDAKRVDARADLFSLGCMLYELVCRRPPFEGEDLLELLTCVAAGEYAPPEDIVPDVPERISAAIRGCLQIDPDERIGDCARLLRTLDGTTAAPSPISAAPVTPAAAAPPEAQVTPEAPRPPRPAPTSLMTTLAPGGVRPAAAAMALGGTGALLLVGGGVAVVAVASVSIWWATSGSEPAVASEADGTADAADVRPAQTCEGSKDERLGWVQVNGAFPYTTSFSSGQARTVWRDQPSEANGWSMPSEAVCELPAGTTIELREPATRIQGLGWWVPVYGEAFVLGDGEASIPLRIPLPKKPKVRDR